MRRSVLDCVRVNRKTIARAAEGGGGEGGGKDRVLEVLEMGGGRERVREKQRWGG